jgi:hypothetical protein
MSTAKAVREARETHQRVCTRPYPTAARSTCECGCSHANHENVTHSPVQTGSGAVCNGRNLAGKCRTHADCHELRLAT